MSAAQECNGWKNYETWNVSLWIQNDEGLYQLARENRRKPCPYKSFVNSLKDLHDSRDFTVHQIAFETPDNVPWNDSGLDIEALDKMMRDL